MSQIGARVARLEAKRPKVSLLDYQTLAEPEDFEALLHEHGIDPQVADWPTRARAVPVASHEAWLELLDEITEELNR